MTEAQRFEAAVQRYTQHLWNIHSEQFTFTVTKDIHGYKDDAPDLILTRGYNKKTEGKNFELVESEFIRSCTMQAALDTPSIAYQPVEVTAVENIDEPIPF